MNTNANQIDSVGRPVVGPDGPYTATPAQVRENFAKLVARFGIDAPIVRAYSPFLYAEATA